MYLKKLLHKVVFLSACFVCFSTLLPAEESAKSILAQESSIEFKEAENNTFQIVGRTLIYLALLAASGIAIIQLSKKGRFVSALGKSKGKLQIEETKVLGNKQFLVVVNYEGEKILLGVGPGMINKLCYLTPQDEYSEKYPQTIKEDIFAQE